MPKMLYVTGGQQRQLRPLYAANHAWQGYQNGLIVGVDVETQECRTCVAYASPPAVRADEDPEILFHAGAMQDDTLYLCTGTEILVYRVPTFERIGYISHPWFNDVHHVRPTPGDNIFVASGGLDLVLEVTPSGDVRRLWNVLEKNPWSRFSPDTDYRKVASTKPHESHPNYVFLIGEHVWATRFHQGDAICLTDPSKRIKVSDERIHDGVTHGDYVYFSVVSGSVVVVHQQTLQVEDVIDLNSMHSEETLLGWCRGLYLDGDTLWVGYSRIRATQFRQNVAWVMRGFRHVLGTHIGSYDLASRRCTQEINLEPAGLNAVFSIFPAR